MSAAAPLIDYKTKAVIKQQLLGDPMDISSMNFTDKDGIDTSLDHKLAMQKKLYGRRKVQYESIYQ